MKLLSHESISDHLLLCIFFSLLWVLTLGITTSAPTTQSVPITATSVHTSTVKTTLKAPENVANVEVVTQNITSITLKWNKVDDISTYRLEYEDDGVPVIKNINYTDPYVVSNLTAGTEYSFTLFTVNNEVSSSGYSFKASTAPENVANVTVVTQNITSITLKWNKVDDISTYRLEYEDDGVPVIKNINYTDPYVVFNLTAGTEYSFTLFTVKNEVNSSGYSFTAATAPKNVANVEVVTQNITSITLKWNKTDDISTYRLECKDDGVPVIQNINNTDPYVVSNLTAGTEYNFTLFTVKNEVNSSGYSFTAATAPENVANVEVVAQNISSITLKWNKTDGISSYKLQYEINDVSDMLDISDAARNAFVQYVVSNLTAGTEYKFTLLTVANKVNSSGYLFIVATAPEKVGNAEVVTQNMNNITVRWKKVDDFSTYKLQYEDNGKTVMEDIPAAENTFVEHVVSSLTAGKMYSFSLLTVANNVNSTTYTFTAATVPLSVSSVNVSERLVDRATLEWDSPDQAWKYDLTVNDTNASITQKSQSTTVSYLVSNLKPGTAYQFTVITMFSDLNSSAYIDLTVTKIDCNTVNWQVTNSSIKGTVEGLFSKATASNDSEPHESPAGKTVSFTDLYPGATYEISLEYELSSRLYPQCSIKIPILPPSLTASCSYWGSGYSALIKWETPNGVWTAVEVIMNEQTLHLDLGKNELLVKGLQPAKTYEVSVTSKLKTEFGDRSSEPSIFLCSTDNRGVIAGSVVGVLLFAVLVCVILFIVLKRPDIIRRKKSLLSGSKKSNVTRKIIPAAIFPEHFHQLSMDENRGFSQEYESLIPVGTDQTQKAATLPENKGRNRFTDILPYDQSRVKLSTSRPNESSDYINANYLPGYNSSKEYIATQGPLPSTVNDFWRMVWEQKVRRIVMVTNFVEAGKTKCELYWSENRNECRYGELMVSKTSEEKEYNWILRDFKVKHTKDSEERTVKHFHFTAWPDHGVPHGTEVLIHFRRLVREHIESEGSKGPTVVHCSAGVGRTGTIVALDVLLQQLQIERAVGIYDFVYKMRQHRSRMVQTESQYVFLHQCIMDSLQPPAMQEENVYENDLIYVNATALQQLR